MSVRKFPPRQYGRQQAGAQAGMGHRCGAPGLRNLFQQEVDACDEAPSREEECEASGEEVAPDEFALSAGSVSVAMLMSDGVMKVRKKTSRKHSAIETA